MLIIFDPTPVENRTETLLEFNIDVYDMCVIRKVQGEKFQLALKKYYDGYFSGKSAIWFEIATLDTHEKCIALYEAIRQARHDGEIEFDLSDYLKKHETVSDSLKSDDMRSV